MATQAMAERPSIVNRRSIRRIPLLRYLLLIFLAAQRMIIRSITLTGVKG